MGVIKVGASAWTEKTLLDSGWYPRAAHDAAARLRYYASRFSLAEVDSTYYAIPTRHQAEVWVERTPAGFAFNVKAYAPFTQHYTNLKRLPKDLMSSVPSELIEKERVYPHELPSGLLNEMARRFRDAIEPLRGSGKLGVVLFQYPVWFTFSPENMDALARTHELVPGCRVAIEFRNRTWISARHATETLKFLLEHDLAYTCVDEPQGFASSVPPVAAVTSEVALLRMHGRNALTWDKDLDSAADRMAYLYRRDELAEWVPRLGRMADRAREVHVVMNNCHRDFAVRNAADFVALLVAAGMGEERPGEPAQP